MEDMELKLVATALRTGGNSSEIREKCGAFPCCLTYLGMHVAIMVGGSCVRAGFPEESFHEKKRGLAISPLSISVAFSSH